MGSLTGSICRACGAHFNVSGGRRASSSTCSTAISCGRTASISHQDLGDIHLRFVKGLPVPYAVSRSAFDREIQANYPGEPLTRDEYHAAAEATLDPCPCGGRFRYDAPARCPECRSTAEVVGLGPDSAGDAL